VKNNFSLSKKEKKGGRVRVFFKRGEVKMGAVIQSDSEDM
jgi:hypothetical protein